MKGKAPAQKARSTIATRLKSGIAHKPKRDKLELRVTFELKQAVKRAAKRSRLTQSAWLEQAIREALEREEEKQ